MKALLSTRRNSPTPTRKISTPGRDCQPVTNHKRHQSVPNTAGATTVWYASVVDELKRREEDSKTHMMDDQKGECKKVLVFISPT